MSAQQTEPESSPSALRRLPRGALVAALLLLCASALCGLIACANLDGRSGPDINAVRANDPLMARAHAFDASQREPGQFITGAESSGCMTCHTGIEDAHPIAASLTCVDCHGGDGHATTVEKAHVQPRQKKLFTSSANPVELNAALNYESVDFVRFINPGDLRAAPLTCGASNCHADITARVTRSMMAHSAMIPQAALYNNGVLAAKRGVIGQGFTQDGQSAVVLPVTKPTKEQKEKGALDALVPAPRWETVPSPDHFRVLDRGNNDVGLRGRGTDTKTSGVALNYVKTRLNDPNLWHMGTNSCAGDFRSSGCTGCHMVYANDSDPFSAGEFAKFGNTGYYHGNDPTIPRNQPGHPIYHKMTKAPPPSQCITCHHHQGNGDLTTFQGYIWWDQESEAAALRQKGVSQYSPNVGDAWKHNADFDKAQFQAQTGHGWLFQKVYRRDIRGRLLDREGNTVGYDSAENYGKALHYMDIHLEKGLACVDCHTETDMHGDGQLYYQMTDAVTIQCVDCHGTFDESVAAKERRTGEMKTSGNPAPYDLKGSGRLTRKGNRVELRSRADPNKTWWVPQLADFSIDGVQARPQALYAHTVQTDGASWGDPASKAIAHSPDKMECYTCHSAWNTSCYGCHLPLETNVKVNDRHFDDEATRGYASYLPQVIRTDSFLIGRNSTTKGCKYSPMRSASAVTVSNIDRNRNVVTHQQETIASSGKAGSSVTPNPPHTVRGADGVKSCTQCHIASKDDNNAWLAHTYGFGTSSGNFMGTYCWVAGEGGVAAVQVTTDDVTQQQPVLGTPLHKVLDPTGYDELLKRGKKLATAASQATGESWHAQRVGEFLFVAAGDGGLKVLDIANIANKSKADRIVGYANSMFGQRTSLSTQDCRFVAVASTMPLDPHRQPLPENQEAPIHPMYRYAYLADAAEGLIVVDITTFFDGNPDNNFIDRAVTFNGGGRLGGARHIAFNGTQLLVSCSAGLAFVDVSNPLAPKLQTLLGEADGLASVNASAVQFRYAFVVDRDGLKTIDITERDKPKVVKKSAKIADARSVALYRTWAIVAAGAKGLAIVDITRPTLPELWQTFNAGGAISDATGVSIASTYASTFAYVADGRNGLRVVRLMGPDITPGARGFAPFPTPELVASWDGFAVQGVGQGVVRDRPVDESGNQVMTASRLGSRPMNAEDIWRMTRTPDGRLLRVWDTPVTPPLKR